jgi:SpoVK/Ycf46/Vps4 family AAA+-type ATPase
MTESDFILKKGLQGGFDEQSLLYDVINQFRTGNIFIDMIMVSIFSSLISFVFFNLQKINLGALLQWVYQVCKNFIWPPTTIQEHVFNVLEVPFSRFYCQTGNNLYTIKSETFDEGNEKVHEAIYDFIHSFILDNTRSELGLKLTEGRSVSETIRSGSFRVRPLDTIIYDGFHINFSSEELGNAPKKEKDNKQDKDKKERSTLNTKQTLIIKSQKSIKEIKDFVEKIYHEWVEKYYPEESSTLKRYYLVMKNASKLEFQGLPMTTEVTFKDIFFPKKKLLMQRIQDYMDNHIKIPKFVILLHGRPGGGKTSFIKALYNLTKCHVININLNDFKNFDDLFRLFHEESIRVSEDPTESHYNKIKIPIKERIYLFEDIDAQDHLVHQRKGEEKNAAVKAEAKVAKDKEKDKEKDKQKDNEQKKKTKQSGKNKKNNSNNCNNGSRNKKEKDRGNENADEYDSSMEDDQDPSAPSKNKKKANKKSIKNKTEIDTDEDTEDRDDDKEENNEDISNEDSDEFDSDSSDSELEYDWHELRRSVMGSWNTPDKEQSNLTLSKILNLLDGVKELNKPFIVLTTNHYDKLDSALVRPGRITWSQELKPIRISDMRRVIKKFLRDSYKYEPLDDSDDEAFISTSGVETSIKDEMDNEEKAKYAKLEELLKELELHKCMPGLFESLCIHEFDIDGVIKNISTHLEESRIRLLEFQEKQRVKKLKREKKKLAAQQREDERLNKLFKNVPDLAIAARDSLRGHRHAPLINYSGTALPVYS